jgi:hypothetical protein
VSLRQKEDPWNSILSGAGAGAVMSARLVLIFFLKYLHIFSLDTIQDFFVQVLLETTCFH